MWDYTDKVMEHFLRPKYAGEIENPDLDATVGNITCGDALRIMLKLDDAGRIADARFQTFGCASAIASSDALIELILGKTVDEAAEVTNDDIAEYLGGLPEQKLHCSVLGMEALQKAIAQYRGEKFELADEGEIVCHCFGVTDKLIEKVIGEHGLQTVEEVTNYTKAGGGCGACHGRIREIIAEVRGRVAEAEAAGGQDPRRLTNVQRMRMIEQTLDTEIRPAVRRDGGDVELVDVIGPEVQIAFRGNCAWCRTREFTADGFIGEKLREQVDPEITVEDVSEQLPGI